MPATIHLSSYSYAGSLGTHVDGAYAFWSINFMCAQREQIDPVSIYVHRDLADCLHRVAMKNDPLILGQPPDLGDGMNRADLVIGIHDRDQHRLVRDRPAHVIGINQPMVVYW